MDNYLDKDLKFGLDATEEENVETINEWVKECETWHSSMLTAQKKSVEYYLGNQTDKGDIPRYNSDAVHNRIFEATETLVPIITGSAHQFVAMPGDEKEVSVQRADKVRKVLNRKYEDLEIRAKLEQIARDIILKRFGVAKWFWNFNTNDVDVKVVDPRNILIPKIKLDVNDYSFPYVIEIQEYTRNEIEDFFPDVDIDELSVGRKEKIESVPKSDLEKRTFQVLEVVTNEVTMWKHGDMILRKEANPYFDFEASDIEETENGVVTKYKRLNNFFDYPKHNYVFFNPFLTGSAPVAETSLCEVVMPIQDDINTSKRRIQNNLGTMGNGQIYLDSDVMDEEQEQNITSEPGQIIVGKNIVSEGRIKREPGTPLPNAHFANMQDSMLTFDNVFGTHGAIRGTSSNETLGGQILDKQQDVTRIDQLTRCINRGVAKIADGLVQMMKMYYDEEHVIKILGPEGATEFIKFSKGDIQDGIVIDVKSGTPVLLDPVSKFNQAIQLWQLGALSAETLFERLEFPNPKEEAAKLLAWKQGQILLDAQLEQMKQQAQDRGVETPNNVIDRAQQQNTGQGKAPLTNTPKTENT